MTTLTISGFDYEDVQSDDAFFENEEYMYIGITGGRNEKVSVSDIEEIIEAFEQDEETFVALFNEGYYDAEKIVSLIKNNSVIRFTSWEGVVNYHTADTDDTDNLGTSSPAFKTAIKVVNSEMRETIFEDVAHSMLYMDYTETDKYILLILE